MPLRLVETMLRPGVGQGAAGAQSESLQVIAFEAITEGKLVNLFDDSGTLKARKADATVVDKEAVGYVIDGGLTGSLIRILFGGINSDASGLTKGDKLFLSTTPGEVTDIAPSDPGNVVQEVGTALSVTNFNFEPKLAVEIA